MWKYAVICAALVALSGCQFMDDIQKAERGPQPTVAVPFPVFNKTPGNFSSCAEFDQWRAVKKSQWDIEYAKYVAWLDSGDWGPGENVPIPISAGLRSDTETNIQVEGVDEDDYLKAGASYIFVARQHSVEIIEKAGRSIVQTLALPTLKSPTLFLYGDVLVVLGHKIVPSGDPPRVIVRRYDKSAGQWTLSEEKEFPGRVVKAAFADGIMTLITSDTWDRQDVSGAGNFGGVACTSIQRPLIDGTSRELTGIHRIDLQNRLELNSVAFAGRAERVYLTANSLYLLTNGFEWFSWDTRLMGNELPHQAFIAKFSWNTQELTTEFMRAGSIEGQVLSHWSMFENPQDESLFLITSHWWENPRVNRIWALNSNLSVLGSTQFAPREFVQSVRFFEGKAYVVTFELNDPLHVFDLSTGGDPRLLSHLEVDGFSGYLHPVGNGQLFGAGVFATGQNAGSLQLSLFDISNPARTQLIDQISYGYLSESSAVMWDTHAFYFNPTSRLLALPLSPSSGSGSLIVELDNGLDPLAEVTHRQYVPENCRYLVNISRFLEVDDSLWAVSPFAVTIHDPQMSYKKSSAIVFADPAVECAAYFEPSGGWCGTQ